MGEPGETMAFDSQDEPMKQANALAVDVVPVARPVAVSSSLVATGARARQVNPAGALANPQADSSDLAGPLDVERQPLANESGALGGLIGHDTDRYAVASAFFGVTAIVPVIFQLLGIAFGIAGLCRLGKAKREGRSARGYGLAWTGLASSLLALAGWIGVFAVFMSLGSVFSDSTAALDSVLNIDP